MLGLKELKKSIKMTKTTPSVLSKVVKKKLQGRKESLSVMRNSNVQSKNQKRTERDYTNTAKATNAKPTKWIIFSKFNAVCQFLGNNVKFSAKAPDSKFKDFNAICPKKDNHFKNCENPWLPKSKRYTMFVGVSYIVMVGLHGCLVKLKCYNLDCYNHDSTIR